MCAGVAGSRLGVVLRGWGGSVVRILVRGEEQCRAGGSRGDTSDTMGPGDRGSLASTGEPGTSRREVSNENIPENIM